MPGIFESITRLAIEEILLNHAEESRFGYILPKDSLGELRDEIFNLLLTSRNLKEAGDKLLNQGLGENSLRRPGTKI